MAKKDFKTAPVKRPQPTDKQIEAFTKSGAGTDKKSIEQTRRLSLDLPADLHTRFKVACAQMDTKMTREVMGFIEQRVKELESHPA